MTLNEKGSKKSVEELYSAIFAIREALQDATQLAAEAAVIAEAFGGEISRVITSQLNQYFIPAISKYIDDEKTPGAMSPLVTFLDSVPLAMTRQEPQPEQTTPAPIQAELVAPPTAAPAEGSYASQKQESKRKRENLDASGIYDEFHTLSARMSPRLAARKLQAAYDVDIYDIVNALDGEYELEDLTESRKKEAYMTAAEERAKYGMTSSEMMTDMNSGQGAMKGHFTRADARKALEDDYQLQQKDAQKQVELDDDFEDEFSDEELTDDEDDLLFTDYSNMNESASETYGVFRIAGELKDDRVFTGTKAEADAFAADRNSKLDKTELDDQGIKYEVRKCTKPEGQKDVSKPGELPKVKEASTFRNQAYYDGVMRTVRELRKDLQAGMLSPDEVFDALQQEGYGPAKAKELVNKWGEGIYDPLTEAFGPMAGPQVGSWPRRDADDGIQELSSENDFDNEDDDFEIVEGPIVEQDRVTVDPAYGGGRGTVTDVRGSYITVKLDDGDVEIYHQSDLVKISESVKTDRWNREAADAQRAEAKMSSKEAELTIAARRVEELLDTGMGSIEAWDTVLEEFPGIDEDALASKL